MGRCRCGGAVIQASRRNMNLCEAADRAGESLTRNHELPECSPAMVMAPIGTAKRRDISMIGFPSRQ